MELRKSRFIRVGSKIGVGVIVGAALAAVPMSPSSATHLTSATLASASVPWGTANVVLQGNVDNNTDAPPDCYYGWDITSTDGTVTGTPYRLPNGAYASGPFFALSVNTSTLLPGTHSVSVNVDWLAAPGCTDDGDTTATGTITITGGRAGSFKCSAYAARTQTDYQPANPSYSPCKDDLNYFAQLQPIAGLGNVGAVRSTTDQRPNALTDAFPQTSDYADAQSHVAGVDLTIGGVRIRTGALWSQSSVNCTGTSLGTPVPKYATNGTVATLNLDGRSFGTTSSYVKIRILNVTIELNKVTSTSTSRIRQALVITRTSFFASTKTVVGESRVGHSGNPCKIA